MWIIFTLKEVLRLDILTKLISKKLKIDLILCVYIYIYIQMYMYVYMKEYNINNTCAYIVSFQINEN